MDTLQTESERLDQYIESLLNMTKLGNETIKLNKEWVGVDELIGAAVRRLKRYRPAQVIHIYLLEEECDLFVDAPLLEQAIFNILDNAVKYTNDGGNIHIVVCKQELFTKISIEDTGKGIIPERQATIFTRFYREPEVHDNDGIGIGLYLAREIIMLQNGYIEVHSKIGKGSTFIIYLPNRD